MKIALLTRSLQVGGAERQLVTLARALHARGHNVQVFVYYSGGALEADLRNVGVPLFSLEKRSRWDNVAFLRRLLRLLRREKPAILHSYLSASNVLSALLKPFVPDMRVVWGLRASDMDLKRYDRFSGRVDRLERRLCLRADLIIANSYAGRDYAVARGFPADRLRVIPNGIDTARFCTDAEARRRMRAQWEASETEIVIGRVGRLDPMKDHPTFLRAAALLAQTRADARFVCVGDGPETYRRRLHALGQELGLKTRLVWTGPCEDMSAVYNGLDIAVSSSAYGEGFPNVLGEAMACGIPCVTTDVGDSARVVGEAGIVVPRNSPEALANGLEIALNGDRPEMARKGEQRIMENFSVARLQAETEKALLGLLA